MSTDYYDWQSALSDDVAQVFAHGAECALADAAANVKEMTPAEHALVGIGFALLAVRSQLAQTGGDVADQLTQMADDVRDLTDTVVAVRRPWWRRLADRLTRRAGQRALAVEACPGDDLDDQARDDGDVSDAASAAGPDATVTPLRRTGARS
ncbi:hypothetical protein ACLQ2P_41715 [Actinomadura citrea]|uniref:hypothetical protein n=1 Tax=Actinomadura citrea TaxID=46158 RepID=UPI003CE4DB6F